MSPGKVGELWGIEAAWEGDGHELRFIVNEPYTKRLRELVAHAKDNPSTTNEPAYRMLQILTRLRGGEFRI